MMKNYVPKDSFTMLMDAIRLANENPQPQLYRRECEMLSEVVLEMPIRCYRMVRGMRKDESVWEHFTDGQMNLLLELMDVDLGLLLAVPDIRHRKAYLNLYRLAQENEDGAE